MTRRTAIVIFGTWLSLGLALAQEGESDEERYRPEDGWVLEPDDSADKDLSDEELIQKYVREEDTNGEATDDVEYDESSGEEAPPEAAASETPEPDPVASEAPAEPAAPAVATTEVPETPARAATPAPDDLPPSPPAKDIQKWPGTVVKGRQLHAAIEALIEREAALHGGYFLFWDDTTKKVWKLTHGKVHDAVTRLQGRAEREIVKKAMDAKVLDAAEREGARVLFSRHDFETDDRSKVVLDLWLIEIGGRLRPAEIRLHQAGGSPRYVFVSDRPYAVKPE